MIRRRWRMALALLVALLLLLWALPCGMSLALRHALTSAGMQDVTIADVDFNPFNGSFGITGLHMRNMQGQDVQVPLLRARFAWWPMLQKRLVVEQVLVQRAHVDFRVDAQGEYHLAGIPLPLMTETSRSDDAAWQIDIRRVSLGGTLALATPWYQGELALDSLQVSDISSMRAQKPFRISMIVHASGATLKLDGELNPFGSPASASGVLEVSRLPLDELGHMAEPWMPAMIKQISGRVHARLPFAMTLGGEQAGSWRLHDATLSVHQLQAEATGSVLTHAAAERLDIGAMDYDGGWVLRKMWFSKLRLQGTDGGKAARQDYEGTARMLKIASVEQGKTLRIRDVRLDQGQLTVHDRARKTRYRLGISGLSTGQFDAGTYHLDALKVDAMQLRLPEEQTLQLAHVSLRDLAYAGQLQLAEMSAGALQWHDASAQARLGVFSADSLQLTGISLQDGALAVQQLVLEAPAAGMDSVEALAARMTVEDIRMQETLSLHKLTVQDSHIHLLRDRQKAWWLGNIPLQQWFRENDEQPWLQRLDQMQWQGGELIVRDQSVSPHYEGRFRLVNARIRSLDRARPAQSSPFHLQLAGRGGVQIGIRGKVRPFARNLTLESQASIHSFSLPSISPLLTETLGYGARTGQLDADLTLNIKHGQLEGEGKLLLRQLEVVKLQGRAQQAADASLSMPLDAALDMLRNSDGDIRLTIPVSGDISRPKFDYQDAINKALGTAVQKAALGYVAQAFQPYGALVAVADLAYSAGKKMFVIKLESIVFAAGDTQPDETRWWPYLERLAAQMKQRDTLRLTLCGKAVPADRSALQQKEEAADDAALLALAAARAQGVRRLLMERFSLPAERLFLCQPAYDEQADGEPRLEMTLH